MTQTKNKTTKKYLDIINSGIITERQIIDLRSFLNNNPEERAVIFGAIHEREGLDLSPEQNGRGHKFLLNLWKTPRGIERKNNPFGYREQEILENFTHFTLKSFYDNSRYGMPAYWLPLYECHSNNNSFEYYYDGEIHIIG
mgnify:CR=1 FL=1